MKYNSYQLSTPALFPMLSQLIIGGECHNLRVFCWVYTELRLQVGVDKLGPVSGRQDHIRPIVPHQDEVMKVHDARPSQMYLSCCISEVHDHCS